MNTPTPAQALGEALKLFSEASRGLINVKWAREAAGKLIEQHGQHFAGLEADLSLANNAIRAMGNEITQLKLAVLDRARRAEAAEARCAELERLSAAISRDCNDCANQRNAANARVREAGGLLRECVVVIHKAAELAGMDPTTEPTPESLGGRVAAFHAANGD